MPLAITGLLAGVVPAALQAQAASADCRIYGGNADDNTH
jgi:hypothetical protein